MLRLISLLLLLTLTVNAQDTILDCFGTEAPISWLGDGFCDDGSYAWNGNAINFNCEQFNYDQGDCPLPIDTIFGCTDMLALNYVPEANFNDGSCEFPIFGCTDPESINYNPLAEADNGSCANAACNDGEAKILLQVTLDQYPGETGWILTDVTTGQPVDMVQAGEYSYNQANTTIPYQLCIPETGVELILSDTYGDGLAGSLYNGGTDGNFIIMGDLEPCGSIDTLWQMPIPNFGSAAYSGVIYLEDCYVPLIEGCMNPNYVEFNSEAEINLPSECETPKVFGCVNDTMFNYAPEANTMELIPVCDYTITIEDDAGDGWGDSYLAVFHGQQQWVYTLGPGIESQSWDIQLESNKPVEVYYFEVKAPQQPIEEVQFQTMHNSFRIVGFDGVELLDGGTNPFEDNGMGALQPFQPPFWTVYSAMPYCGDYCEPIVYGCIYEYNFNSTVQMFNYNPDANTYDPEIEACEPVVYGCTDGSMYGYNILANIDDGSCVPFMIGCMDTAAWNYQVLANMPDPESCLYFGCTDSIALNYDSTANVNNDNCIYPILGCTQPEAFNFEVDANVNDGTCIPVLIGCMDPTMYNYNEEANTASDNCIPFIFGCTDTIAFNYDPIANTDNESCTPITPGCTDPNAFNFNAEANTEDFSCLDIIYGCTDETAFNYDLLANTDNGGCIDVLEGCMDPLGYNYDAVYNTDDRSCLYDAGCIDGPGIPYWLNDTCYAWVILIDPYCCNNSWDDKCQQIYWSCSWDSPLDTRDLLRGHNVVMYPNPMGDMLNILTNGPVSIKVYDISGKLVIKIKENQTHKGLNQLDVSLLSAGIYNFSVTYNGNTSTRKVLKK